MVRLNPEYRVSESTVLDTYKDWNVQKSTTPEISLNSGRILVSDQLYGVAENSRDILESDIGYKLDYYNVKSFDSFNALYMELNTDEVNQLLLDPKIASIEEDKPIEIAESALTEVESESVKESAQTIPWGIHSSGSYMVQTQKEPGMGSVKVAVFDTGISDHPDLAIAGGVSFVESSGSYWDDNGHGTHIAGTIAASDNGIGVLGMAPLAEVYAVKVMDANGDGQTSSVIQGIDWAIQNDIDMINMSFVSSQYSAMLHEAIQDAVESGILVIAAAGNMGSGTDTVQYPAKYPEVVAVGAVDPSHHRTDFSSTGSELDLVGPGFGILSTKINGEYGVASGTSNAAAHVTGAAALLWSNQRSLTGQEIIQQLYDHATVLGMANEYGHGLINLAKAEGMISGPIAPLSDENLSGLNTVLPSEPEGEIGIASYDKQNDGATIYPGDSVTVSLKLEGNEHGENPHTQIVVEVYPVSNPSNIVATRTILNPQLDVAIPFTWQTTSSTPTGTYHIKYRYTSIGTGNFDDIFVIYVAQSGVGPDTYEPNDTFLTAKSVVPGNSYISYISSGSDIDYYKLTTDQTGELDIQLTIPFALDYELYVYNQSGVQVGQSSNGTGASEFITLQVAEGATYYIKVIGFSGQFSSSPYTLILGEIQVQPFLAPTGLEYIPSANSIKLTWDAMPEAVSYLLKIDGTQAGTATTPVFTFTNLSPMQTYTLEVAAVYSGGTSSYSSIQASTTIPELIVFQPEDMDQLAGTSQLYSFTPATTGVYRIYTSPYGGSGATVDTELGIYSDLQLTKALAVNDDVDDTVFSEISISLVGGQTYYVRVSGFDSTRLRARVTADVVSSTIPYLQLDQPVDIHQQSGSSNVYVFIPAQNGKYRFSTSPYSGSSASRSNDTELAVYSNLDMAIPITNGYNDDKNDSVYSEVIVNLSAGTPYYVQVNEVNGGKVFARLTATSAGEASFAAMQLGQPVDLSVPRGEDAYLQFTPSHSGTYRFFTANYPGLAQLNDTEIGLYADPDLQNLIDFNDDVKSYKPYGELFSKLEVNLNAGTTYYLVVRSFGSFNGLQARFVVESMEQASRTSARSLTFGQLVDTDANGNPATITSLYDVDYYRIELTEPRQISLYLSAGEGAIEDANGNVRGYFDLEGEQVFNLDAGIYYLRVENDVLHTNRQALAWNFSGYAYELSADLNEISYTHGNYGEEMAALRAFSANLSNSFDATIDSGDYVEVNYKHKKNHSQLFIQVTTGQDAYTVYETTMTGNFQAGQSTTIRWDGSVNSTASSKNLFASSYSQSGRTYYWAKSGNYKIYVYRMDGTKKKDASAYRVEVFNDPLNRLNVIPVPYTHVNGKEITAKDINSCKQCYNYFERYVYDPDTWTPPLTAYEAWFGDMYGVTGLRMFWQKADQLVSCDDEPTDLAKLQCTITTIGMIPFIGESADVLNGVIYLVNGDYAGALLSTASIVPYVGNGIAGAKKFNKIYKSNPCGCLPEGTSITTKDGVKPVEDIQVGDLVLAKYTDTGVQAFKPVEKLFSSQTEEIFTLKIGDTTIETTGNHPFWVKGEGWVPADELKPGDQLETETGNLLTVDAITVRYEVKQVYNFTVSDFHTYYISDLGILTHNLLDVCQIQNYANVSPNKLTNRVKGTPSAILEAEIKKATGLEKPNGWAAHHIVPYKKPSPNGFAKELQDILDENGIDLNSSANGVYLPPGKGASTTVIDGQTMTTHNGYHVSEYFEFVLKQIDPVRDDRDEIVKVLNDIRQDLLHGRLKLGNLNN